MFNDHYFVHPFIKKAYDLGLISNNMITYEELIKDDNVWKLPPYAFYTRWFHLIKKPLKTFMHHFSINIPWKK